MPTGQYAVFFEASNLSEDDMIRIRKYFQIRRLSGGGDCGELQKVAENTYKIAFKDQRDQERVLCKTDHTVNLPRHGNLQIVVRRHEIQEDKKTTPSLSGQQMASGGKPMEMVLKLDPHLLRFLKESAAAGTDLELHLSNLSSSYKVDLESEKVVVFRNQVQSDEDDVAQKKWEAKVENIFWEVQDHYLIHFEVEFERLMIMKQNLFLPTENLGIYRDGGTTVIVGEKKEMAKFLTALDALQLQQEARKEYPVSEMQYALVKEQFEQEMKANYSEIKMLQERNGFVELKGLEKQVQAAGTKLQQLVNQIQEERIQLHQALIKFLSSSGAMQNFQTRFQQSLRSPVLLETRGSALVLLSLSTGALQEAANAVQRDMCVESVPLERGEAESPGIDTLKEALREALQQANHGSTRVELTYDPGTNADPGMKVQLVGYSTEVSTLKGVIQDYRENHAKYSDSLPLHLPEMVDHFSDLLALVGVKSSRVNLAASHLPSPCIQLSGPRCEVKDLKEQLESALGSLARNNITLEGPGVVQFFKEEGLNTRTLVQNSFQVLIVPKYNEQSSVAGRIRAWTSLPNLLTALSSPQRTPAGTSVALEIVFGGLEEQQVDVLVAPMLKTNLKSTKVGICLLEKAGEQLKTNFDVAKGKHLFRLMPGDVLDVDGTPLGCNKVFFIQCVPWTQITVDVEKVLCNGLERALSLCEQQGWSSIAMPLIGPGPALSVPVKDATDILMEVISTFGRSGSKGSLKTICIAIMPNYPDSEEIYQAIFTGLSAQMVDEMGQAVFQSLSSEIEEINVTVGRCQLHLVLGDISNEVTDAVVNTTDFNDFQTDVCSDILTVAGPQVQGALTGVRVNKGEIFTTQPGNFPCKVIMHVCGEKDAGIIKGLARDIVAKCESDGYQSVAIPAICAGKGGLEAHLVAQSILQGVKDAAVGVNFRHLKTIRIVILKINVFLEFKAMAQQLFGTFTQMTAPSPLRPFTAATRGHQPSSLTIDLSSLVQSLPVQQSNTAEFLVMGSTPENVSGACRELRRTYERECTSQSYSAEVVRHLGQDELAYIKNNVDSLGISITQQWPNEFVVKGLSNGVNEINRVMQGALVRQMTERDQDALFARVSWCILGFWGDWERLPKKANHQLENKNVTEGVMDAQRRMWKVNLIRMEATAIGAPSTVARLKRLENLSDFSFPLYWDSMAPGETLKLFPLASSSAEYQRVKSDFKRTAQKTVLKIERIQNVHLRRAYEVRKKELQDKNGSPVGAGEKVLYHGTSDTACSSIQRSNFDRRYAGQNATRFGIGTYFAVNANYSAHPTFSVPAADGTQLMFVALVLTGHHTQGHSTMIAPPPRTPQDPNDRFDSLVDKTQNPEMFVVFHDCQAYPDYLITGRSSKYDRSLNLKMPTGQYAVFFEASNLSEDDMIRIRKYFRSRRLSGGGDCGEVQKVAENTYKIAFKDQRAQERVLSKTDHTVNLPRHGDLHIMVHRHEIQEDKKTTPLLSGQQMASGGKPMEMVLKLDPHLLRFLKESAAAGTDLELRLSNLSSSYKVDLESEKVVVFRNQVQSGEDDVAQKKWEAKVENIFWEVQDRYPIHFEVEFERLMIMKQNLFLPTENLGIYRDGGITVIVGEKKEMGKFLTAVDALQLQQEARKEYPVSEMQYALVKEQFEQEMKSDYSGIKMLQERNGFVELKGPEKQVQAAGTKLQQLVNQIQEERIQLHQALIKFLSSSGAMQNFQTRFQQSLRCPVLLEPRGSALVLLSLSSGALQEAANAVQREVCVESVPLERGEAESPGIDTLKEALRQALQQANHGSTRVELTYDPGTNADPGMKVQLVGYSTEVSTLKGVIQDYRENHAKYSDSLPLHLPEMVDNFSDLLALVGVKSARVNLAASHLPSPCVLLSGPRCEVKDLKEQLESALGSLIWDNITLEGPGVVQFFRGEGLNTRTLVQNSFQVLIVPKYNTQSSVGAARSTAWTSLPNLLTALSSPQRTPAGTSVALEIAFGGLEQQKVDVLVVPMLKTNLKSTAVGKCLLEKAGEQLKTNFDVAKGKHLFRLMPGDVLDVDGTPLGCNKVFFIECVPWTQITVDVEKVLCNGLERALSLCAQQGWSSIAMPLIGPGPALSVPVKDATEVISTFGRSGSKGSLKTIRIAIMPNYPDSEEIYQAIFTSLSAQMVDQMGQASLAVTAVFQSLSSEIEEIKVTVGRCQLHLVLGDISNEVTDAVVNTTNFTDFQTDVCSDILTVAGPQVQDALTGGRKGRGFIQNMVYNSLMGHSKLYAGKQRRDLYHPTWKLPQCKVIMHVSGKSDTGVIKGLARDIVLKCESDGYQSVAIPAICAGKGGLEARLVAQSILQGVKDAAVGVNFRHLKTIRIVILKINVFLEFKAMAQELFVTQMTAPAPLRPFTAATRGHQPSSLTIDLSSLVQSLPVQQSSTAEFLVMGSTPENVSGACRELRHAYERECTSQSYSAEVVRHLGQDELDRIKDNADSLGISITQQWPNEFVVKGLSNGVNEINRVMQGALVRQMTERDQDALFARVSWCILGSHGDWERLPKKANHQLENKNVTDGVMDAQGRMWKVNLIRMEATAIGAPSTVAKLKRLENLSDFSFPLYWDSMAPGKTLKLFPLASSSAEYQRVKSDFKRTAQKTVLKIERIQNVHLRRAYEGAEERAAG
ncbi:hypothetical protein NFI96_016730 [Prochilodus magdalenae]|nr:hypothetical protein NFI96_016730 [Prochilodus magdalenae]